MVESMEEAGSHPGYVPKTGVSHWTSSVDMEDVFL